MQNTLDLLYICEFVYFIVYHFSVGIPFDFYSLSYFVEEKHWVSDIIHQNPPQFFVSFSDLIYMIFFQLSVKKTKKVTFFLHLSSSFQLLLSFSLLPHPPPLLLLRHHLHLRCYHRHHRRHRHHHYHHPSFSFSSLWHSFYPSSPLLFSFSFFLVKKTITPIKFKLSPTLLIIFIIPPKQPQFLQ